MSKPKAGFYWCASCGGCEESVVDLAEDILAVVEAIDFVFFPVAMDFKREDVEAMADGEMTVCFINGAIRTSEQREMAELLRRKSQVLIAFGSCSHLGGIPGLANLWDRKTIFATSYHETPSTGPSIRFSAAHASTCARWCCTGMTRRPESRAWCVER